MTDARMREWYERATQISEVSSHEIEAFLTLVAKSYGFETIDALIRNVDPVDHWANEENARQGQRAIRAGCLGNYSQLLERMELKFTTPDEEKFMDRHFGLGQGKRGRPKENNLRDEWIALSIEAFRAAGLTKAEAFEEVSEYFDISLDRAEKIYKTNKLSDRMAQLIREYFGDAKVADVQEAINALLAN